VGDPMAGEGQIVALAVHAHRDVPDARPRIGHERKGVERAVIRGHGAPGEPERCQEKPAGL
jgi:hypothetical protein